MRRPTARPLPKTGWRVVEREELAHELRQAEAAEDEPDQAEALTAKAEGILPAPGPDERPASGPARVVYSRSSERELVDVSQAARNARLDSAPGFGQPTKDAMKKDQAAKTRIEPTGADHHQVRERELER
jgi:hypothetical protein